MTLRRLSIFATAFLGAAGFAGAAAAQALSVDLGGEGALTLQVVQLFLMLTVLSLAPGIAIMVTCFPFMVTVLSILRQAVGVQQAPPNMLIVSLALFLTYFVMAPTFDAAWRGGVGPFLDGELTAEAAFTETLTPFRGFMEGRVDPMTIDALREAAPMRAETAPPETETPLSLLIPSFLLSEIKRAFEIGFLIFIPFLIIDLVVASILMAMGMMMVPPAIVSLPFKLAFFVLADGWTLLAGALVRGYGT
ncbi:flagellar type III secretion system pore protein FliP [Pikeienuella piscinae]|uniref:Flagellar biosynthetic protein FliP n=1 Tax=Pikeienuella piscinae TaxID=2748098 RepID=A0A7L5BXY6_9RHOB|nr:flagellar type III secretion system pore protein FliP [Pikeienuella piscinae]QIE55387.1 flagellar type III secretion system pore protein FliP [Pikeienuella piscinae]